MRLLMTVMAVMGLGGCTIVGSDAPLFATGDGAGAPKLRHGLWAAPTADCSFDPDEPGVDWPRCANGTLVTADTLQATSSGEGRQDEALAYVLAAGDPRVMQLRGPKGRKPDEPSYVYFGVRPLKSDRQGRIIELRAWLALCAEPPSPDQALKRPAPAKPPPGLTLKEGDPFCRAATPGPVREAVRRTEGWLDPSADNDFSLTGRWVRESLR